MSAGEKMSVEDKKHHLILVTGSTGYIGGRLVPRLIEQGYHIRCLVRDPARLQAHAWLRDVEIVAGDVLQPDSLVPAMQGVSAAYYLVHSMSSGSDFHQLDLTAPQYLAALLHSRSFPEQAYRSCLGVLSLARKYPGSFLETACQLLLDAHLLSYGDLKSELERQACRSISDQSSVVHENIRGETYYH